MDGDATVGAIHPARCLTFLTVSVLCASDSDVDFV